MSIVKTITVTGATTIDVITVGTQGASGPNTILNKSVNSITLASADNGGALVYDSGNGYWSVSTQDASPVVKVRELTFKAGGASVTQILDEDNMASNSNVSLATQQSIKAYIDTSLAAHDLTVNNGSSTISIDHATEELGILGGTGVTSSVSGNNVTLAIGQAVATTDNVTFNNVVVSGNLTVSGTQTTVNTATLSVADNVVVLNSDYSGSSPSENAGLEIERGTQTNVTWIWNESTDSNVLDFSTRC